MKTVCTYRERLAPQPSPIKNKHAFFKKPAIIYLSINNNILWNCFFFHIIIKFLDDNMPKKKKIKEEKKDENNNHVHDKLVYTGERKIENVKISVLDYEKDHCVEKNIEHIEECFPFRDTPEITWINIKGIHDTEIIEKLGKHFKIHPLTLEDILNTNQRPKIEDFGDFIFVIFKMIYYNEKTNDIDSEQISIIFGSNFVLSFQETEGKFFDNVKDRIIKGKGKIRKMGSDYLAYVLMDTVVDNYFVILEKVGEKIEDLEEELIANPTPKILQAIHDLKRSMIILRKSVWPLREILSGMERGELVFIQDSTKIYIKDVYDHTVQIIDTIETYRDILAGMIEIYLSSISNRMNEIMKVLTIITTIFIPLTVVTGIYGMNFKHMPEIEWQFGYYMVLIIMLSIGISMLLYFKKRKWI